MTDQKCAVYAKNEIELPWPIDRVEFVMKIIQENDVIERTDASCIENNIKLLWPIESGTVYGKN